MPPLAAAAAAEPGSLTLPPLAHAPALYRAPVLPSVPQEEMYSFVTLAEDQNSKKGVVVLEA